MSCHRTPAVLLHTVAFAAFTGSAFAGAASIFDDIEFVDSGQALGNDRSRDVALGDLDGDGDLDAFVINASAACRVWVNDGTASFTDSGQEIGVPYEDPPYDWASYSVVDLGDVDGDGDLDAFIGNIDGFTSTGHLFLNDGNGIFTDSGQRFLNGETFGLQMADLDGDFDLDVFVTRIDGQSERVWLNDGTGIFTDSGQSLGNSFWNTEVALGDLDGDGDIDAFTTLENGDGNKVWVNFSNGIINGNFSDSGQELGTGESSGLALGDFDGDGDLDAMVANGGEMHKEPNTVWTNDGNGAFTDSGQILGNSYSTSVALGDLDGDGDLDAMVSNLGEPDTIWTNDGTGTFTDSGLALGNGYGHSVALGDLDGDGDIDAFVANYGNFPEPEPNTVWLNTREADTTCMSAALVGSVQCVSDASGLTGTYSVELDVINQSDQYVHYLLIPDATMSPNMIPMSPVLGPGQTVNITVEVVGDPYDVVCVPLVLIDVDGEECCSTEVCFELPECDCANLEDLVVDCVESQPTTFELNFTITNLTADVIEHLYFLPEAGSSTTITPDYLDIPGLPSLGSTSVGPIFVETTLGSGAVETILIGLHDAALRECCLEPLSFTIPDCGSNVVSADLNDDGVVDGMDLTILLASWGRASDADFDGDGTVSGSDLAVLLGQWGR